VEQAEAGVDEDQALPGFDQQAVASEGAAQGPGLALGHQASADGTERAAAQMVDAHAGDAAHPPATPGGPRAQSQAPSRGNSRTSGPPSARPALRGPSGSPTADRRDSSPQRGPRRPGSNPAP